MPFCGSMTTLTFGLLPMRSALFSRSTGSACNPRVNEDQVRPVIRELTSEIELGSFVLVALVSSPVFDPGVGLLESVDHSVVDTNVHRR